MAESRKYRGKRYSIVLRKPISEAVEALAVKEDRPISQMITRLVEEAIAMRNAKNTESA